MQMEELEKMANDAKARYDTLCEVVAGIKEKIDPQVIKEKFMDNPDCFCFYFETLYLFLLLNIACMDKVIDYNEIVLLRLLEKGHQSLEKYLDDVAKRKNKRFNYEDLSTFSVEKTRNMLEELNRKWFSDIGYLLISTLQELKGFNIRQYYQIFRECTLEIVNALLWIDHQNSKMETEKAMQYISDVFLYPLKRISILAGIHNPPELKKICEEGKHYKSLVELVKIRPTLYTRKQGFKVNYVQHPNLIENALVYIETDQSTGSGFIISEKGLCVTCAHVVSEAKHVYARVTLENGRKEIHECQVVMCDKDHDFAIIKLETENQYFFDYEKSYEQLGLGREIAIVGYPFGVGLSDDVMELRPTLTKGYISSKQTKDESEYYFLDASARPGNSGGPVFDGKSGKVVGYLCGAYGDVSNKIVFMRSLEFFIDKLDEMVKG